MRILNCLAVLAAATGLAGAATNTPAVRQLTLQDAIQEALERNLDLRISRYNPSIAAADLWGTYGGYNPTFSFSGAHNYSTSGGGFNPNINTVVAGTTSDSDSFNSSLGGLTPWGLNYSLQGNMGETYGTRGATRTNPVTGILEAILIPFDTTRGQGVGITLTQPLLKNFWIDSTRLNIRVAKNRLKYSELGLKSTVMSTITQVEQAYYALVALQENVAVQQKAVELATQLVAENRKRVEVGALAPLDEKQAEAQAASSQAALIAAQSSLAVQQNNLRQLMTDDYAGMGDTLLQAAVTLTAPVQVFDRQISWSKGLTERPDVQQARLDIEQQGINLKYSYNQLFPQLDVLGTYGYSASGDNVREFSDGFGQIAGQDLPNWSVGGRISMPLGNRSARATLRHNKLALEQLTLSLKRLEQTVMVTLDNDIKQAQSSYEQVGATRAAREYASDALDAERKKLESGKSTTYTVLQMQRDLTSARGNEIQALANYVKALSQLSLDEGTTLDRLNIDWQAK